MSKGVSSLSAIILQAETLNLPEIIAMKLKGKKVELIENGESVVITPVKSDIASARGMLKGGNFGTVQLMEQKQIEKELEYGN